ncbi:MAG: hypothetical protein U1E83_04675 [Methylotetracoccus sp.]
MFETLFSEFNHYLMRNPGAFGKLKLLFWIKYWALLLIFSVFLYLVYREQYLRKRQRRMPTNRSGRPDYCMKA